MLKNSLRLGLLLLAMGSVGCPSGGSLGDDDDTSNDDDSTADAGPEELAGWCDEQDDDFSFFVTSMAALWALSGDDISDLDGGFGGDFGGLAGADDICQGIATATGHGDREWRAFLSANDDGNGNAVHAIERIGSGPWTDANGRLVATGIDGLLDDDRPDGEAQSVDDLPDECGVPTSVLGDSHDVVTGTGPDGRLASTQLEFTCNDWTTSDGNVGGGTGGPGGGEGLKCGHSWPRAGGGGGPGGGGQNWMSDHSLRGCGKGANLIQNGPGEGTSIGASGGYGAMYCFAL